MSNFMRGIHERLERLRPSPAAMWVDVPLEKEPLAELMLFGDGKDAEVIIQLLDGRQYQVALAKSLRVRGCPGLEVEALPWDDRSLVLRYFGSRLVISRLRFEVPTWDGGTGVEEFNEAVGGWVASGGEEALAWALAAEIELTQVRPTT